MRRPDMLLVRGAVLGGVLLLAGCAVGPDYREPEIKVAGEFAAGTLLTPAQGDIEREWWRQFGDPLLDELVDAAVRNNHDIAAATARLREARAQRRERLFDFLPSITGTAGYDRGRQSASGTPGLPAGTPIDRD